MAEDYSLFDYPSEQKDDRRPLWNPKDTKPEANVFVVSAASLLAVCRMKGLWVGSAVLAAFVFCLLILQLTLLARLELRN